MPIDTAAKLQAVKEKAREANDTAKAVLAQVKDLHQNLDGLKQNYNKLADSVAKTNAVVKDPSKNSKSSFLTVTISSISSCCEGSLDSRVVELETLVFVCYRMGVRIADPTLPALTSPSNAWEPSSFIFIQSRRGWDFSKFISYLVC